MWKQPVSISRELDKEDMVYIYIYIYIYIYTHTLTHTQWGFTQPKKGKKKGNLATTCMVLEEVMPSEISETLNSKYYVFTDRWNLKMKQQNYSKIETDSTIQSIKQE